MFGVLRIHENAAARQDAIDVGHHRGDPAHVEVLAQRSGLAREAFVDISRHRCIPVAAVRHVDGEFGSVCGNLDFRFGQHPAAEFAVEGKTGDAIADGEHEDGRWAVDGKTSRDLL